MSLGLSQASGEDTRTSAGTGPRAGTRARAENPGPGGRRDGVSGVRHWRGRGQSPGIIAEARGWLPGAPSGVRPGRLALFGGPGWTRSEGVKRPECAYSAQLRTTGTLGPAAQTRPYRGSGRRPLRVPCKGRAPAGLRERTYMCLPSISFSESDSSSGPRKPRPRLPCGRNGPLLALPQRECGGRGPIRMPPPAGHGDWLRAE